MVAIRRQPGHRKSSTSLLAFKILLLLFIVGQSIRLIWKISSGDLSTTSTGGSSSSSLLDLVAEKENSSKQKNDHHIHDHHSDHDDDYVEDKHVHEKVTVPEIHHQHPAVEQGEGTEDDEDQHAKIINQGVDKDEEVDDDYEEKDEDKKSAGEDDEEKEKTSREDDEEEGDVGTKNKADEVKLVNRSNSKLDEKTKAVMDKLGTGVTKYGFVVDMVHQREHPVFRTSPLLDPEEDADKLLKALPEDDTPSDDSTSFRSCDHIENGHIKQHEICQDSDTILFAYNSADFARSICGKDIEPLKAVKLDDDHCENLLISQNLLAQDKPPIDGKGMPAIVIQSHPTRPLGKLMDVDCDIPCKYEENMKGIERYVQGTPWKILYSEMEPGLPSFDVPFEQTAYRKDTYFSIHSMKSSIPLSLYDFKKYNLRDRPALDWGKIANKVTYLQDSECSAGRRNKWAAAIQSAFDLAAYGSCNHNTDLDEDDALDTIGGRISIAKQNRIHLVIERGGAKDYVTPQIWESLLSGAVPAIIGAPNLDSILPAGSFINGNVYNSWDKFAEFVKSVAEDESLWNSYHKWRTNESEIKAFEERMGFVRTSTQCRTCRWAYAKKYGLGWDHAKQMVEEPALGRDFCISSENELIVKPFREEWFQQGAKVEPTGSERCPSASSQISTELSDFRLKRSVQFHDGVTDITLSMSSGDGEGTDTFIRLSFDVRNSHGAYFRNPHSLVPTERGSTITSAAIQDEKAKITVLADWETKISSPEQGIIQVSVDTLKREKGIDALGRIRIIVESSDILHDKLTEFYPTSYSKMMVKDFVDPIELFYTGK